MTTSGLPVGKSTKGTSGQKKESIDSSLSKCARAKHVVENGTKICATHVLALLADAITDIKDVRAHCYCASLMRTLYMTWHVPRHVF